MKHTGIIILLWLLFSGKASGIVYSMPFEDADSSVYYAEKYRTTEIKQVAQYEQKWTKAQDKLLKKLQKKESKLLKQLAEKDSIAYRNYLSHSNNRFDSLRTQASGLSKYSNPNRLPELDKIKSATSFLQEKTSTTLPFSSNDVNITGLEQKIKLNTSVDQLIQAKIQSLGSLAKIHGLTGISDMKSLVSKQQQQWNSWKDKLSDPDEAEAYAWEYLQGTDGFSDITNKLKQNAFGGLGNQASEQDLKRLGYQTKSSVSESIKGQLGTGYEGVMSQMGNTIASYQEKYGISESKLNALKFKGQQIKDSGAYELEKAGQASINKVKTITKANRFSLKGAPIPFSQKWHLQYSFQVAKASTENQRPAISDLGIGGVYQQNKWLSASVGIGLSIGLGKDLAHLKPSYEGISLRSSVTGSILYGFGLQIGYERYFIPSKRAYLQESDTGKSFLGRGGNLAYIGINKKYRINQKWSGGITFGYNFLYKENTAFRSPFIIRMTWE